MPRRRIVLMLDTALLERFDVRVVRRAFRNRSEAVEASLADMLRRRDRSRLARECAQLNPLEEKRLADEGMLETPQDAVPWQVMLDGALQQTGGSLSRDEQAWADRILSPARPTRRRRKSA
jgi:Arc/MetJ-type ribon-helix-helix transcriptional regulator